MSNLSAFHWRERGEQGYISVGLMLTLEYTLSRASGAENAMSAKQAIEYYNRILSYPPTTLVWSIVEFRSTNGYPIVVGHNLLMRIRRKQRTKKDENSFQQMRAAAIASTLTVGELIKKWNLQPISASL